MLNDDEGRMVYIVQDGHEQHDRRVNQGTLDDDAHDSDEAQPPVGVKSRPGTPSILHV